VDLVSPYTRFYRLAEHFNPDFKKTLMIGGGAYVFPQYYLKAYPQASIDVVEIDPELTSLAKGYFSLPDDPRLHIIHQDGRSYLNQNQEKYDVVLMDAFNSISIPPQLTTKEAVQKIYDSLADDGVVLVNVISAVSGSRSAFFEAEYATYQSVFPQVLVFVVNRPDLPEMAQNIMIVALKSPSEPILEGSSPDIQAFLKNISQPQSGAGKEILTDDYAPVDYYMSQILL
jgi:spermidine synthase